MKKLASLLLVLFTFSCAGFSPKQDYNLEVRMEVLEKELKRIELMAAAGEAAAVDRAWPFYGLVGGGNALDGITEASIGDNDFAIGRDSAIITLDDTRRSSFKITFISWSSPILLIP